MSKFPHFPHFYKKPKEKTANQILKLEMELASRSTTCRSEKVISQKSGKIFQNCFYCHQKTTYIHDER